MKNKLLSILLIIMCGTSCDYLDKSREGVDLALTLDQAGAGCTNFEVYTWNADKSIFVVIRGTIPNLENGPGMLQYDLSSSTDISVSYDSYGKIDDGPNSINFIYCNDAGPNPEIDVQAQAVQGTVDVSFANYDPNPELPWDDNFTVTITLSDVYFGGGVEDYISSLTLSDVYVGWRPG